MSTSLQKNFKEVREQYAIVFNALERVLKRFDIDFYIIGAQARDIWISHLGVISRLTKDIDYCVLVSNRETWNQLNEYLIKTEKFERDKNAPHRFYLNEHTIDIIPFGGIQNGEEVQLDNPLMDISVFGCREVAEEAEDVAGGFKIVSLSGLCVLKLVAYSEKPERVKDWDDFLLIVQNYSDIAGEQLFDGRNDDLIDDSLDMKIAAARMLGRHMNSILNKKEELKKVVLACLNSKLMNFTIEEVAKMYLARDSGDTQVETLKLIAETIKGIND